MIVIIKHIAIEGPGILDDFFRGTTWSLREVNLFQGENLPSKLDGIDAIVSLGGPMNAYEEGKYPFLKEEDVFLRKAIQERIPILGICLGAQLVAKACGAEVIKSPQPEIGWSKVSLTDAGKHDPLFQQMQASELLIFQWHEDTFSLPSHAVHLAQSPTCRNQAFRVGENVYGLQFHIEVTPEIIESWIQAYMKEETLRGKNMLLESYKNSQILKQQAERMSLNFARIMNASRATASHCG
jgi:GMP synthase-like glutamine amidotransferase